MKMQTLAVAVAIVTGMCAAVAEEPRPDIRLALDLVDGSRVVGSATVAEVPVITEYSRLAIPFPQIQTVEMNVDRERVTVKLANGDKITGVVKLDKIGLKTSFGDVAIGLPDLLKISVLGDTPTGGLALHYSFDKDADGKVYDCSGQRCHGSSSGVRYVDGIDGKGIRTSSPDTYAICFDAGLGMDGWSEMTVSAWVKLDSYTSYGKVLQRGKEGDAITFDLSIGGNYGSRTVSADFAVGFGKGRNASVTIPRFAGLNRWYHLAGVYDGRTVKYYVDGDQAGVVDVPDDLAGKPIMDKPGSDLLIGKSATARTWQDTHIVGTIDEVMIFKRGLSAAEVRRLYDNLKPRDKRISGMVD